MVNIYLNINDRQVLALSIPFSDIERLSVRPVKWLRFVTFTVCGVRGDLSATPNGPPVDYDSISLVDPIADAYYYTPEGDYHIIDYNALNGRNSVMSSDPIIHSSSFRSEVMARDGPVCVFTGAASGYCDAAHLLPLSKGDEYIEVVLRDRLNSYETTLEQEPEILGIDSVENGALLRKDLHAGFAHGLMAFLKTPNFALDTADIPRVEVDPMPPSRLTLQHLEPDSSRDPLPQFDARIIGMGTSKTSDFALDMQHLEPDTSHDPIRQRDTCITGTGTSLPSTVVLDFIYGVAAYRRWGGGQDIEGVMQRRFDELYKDIPVPPASRNIRSRGRGKNHSSDMSDEMLRAMDTVLGLSMLLKGTTPEMIAEERQRREEAEELRAKEASQVKVQQWMQTQSSLCVPCSSGTPPNEEVVPTVFDQSPLSKPQVQDKDGADSSLDDVDSHFLIFPSSQGELRTL